MSKNVFANGREVSAKKDGNQTIAAMPDVCLSPPSPPAGPVPIPYPNTSMASDTSDGTKTVKIGGDEVGIKNSSSYKKSTGDEAATKSLGMGVNTATLSDKLRFTAWSFDVKYEGENAIRHMDMTTGNHVNTSTSVDPGVSAAAMKPGEISDECKELDKANQAEVSQVDQSKIQELQKKDDGGWALTTAKIQGAPGPADNGIWNAVSNRSLLPKNSTSSYKMDHPSGPIPKCSGLVAKKDVKATEKTKAVKKGSQKNWTERGKDSEAKLLGPLMAAADAGATGIKITMKVYHEHNASPGQPDSLPCWSCREAICGAENCKIEVTLCTNDNRAVKGEDLCKGPEPKPAGAPNTDKQLLKKHIKQGLVSKETFWKGMGFGPR